MALEFKPHIRRPFEVTAIRVTEGNLDEVAELLGRVDTDSSGRRHVVVDPDRVPHAKYVYPGYWITRMGTFVRCYTNKRFRERYVILDDLIIDAVQTINEGGE